MPPRKLWNGNSDTLTWTGVLTGLAGSLSRSIATLAKYGERVAMVHLKDYRIGRISPVAFDALDAGDRGPWEAELARVVQFAEVGEGNLDFRSIIDKSIAIGAKYLLVEQDEHYGRTPLECLQTSYDNLVKLGYRELFEQ